MYECKQVVNIYQYNQVIQELNQPMEDVDNDL